MSNLPATAAAAPLALGWTLHAAWLRHRIHTARRDPLTGLPRRDTFERQATRLLPRRPHAALVIDLDGFKALNDTYGHGAGDTALHVVGQRLTTWAKPSGIVARLGGDEFTALAPCDRPDSLPDRLRLLHAALCEPIPYEDTQRHLGASIGAAWKKDRTTVLSSLLRRADEAMYTAKQAGGGWRIATGPGGAFATVNGRRCGRPGTHRVPGGAGHDRHPGPGRRRACRRDAAPGRRRLRRPSGP